MSMKLQYNLENIGNIDNASITIKPLTIIAGENSSGKTFVTKSLYSILSHIQKNYFVKEFIYSLSSLEKEVLIFLDDEFTEEFEKSLQEIHSLIQEFIFVERKNQKKFLDKNKNIFSKFELDILSFFKNQEKPHTLYLSLEYFIYLSNHFQEISSEKMMEKLVIAFKKNFQITDLQDLINKNSNQDVRLVFDKICDVTINHNLEISIKDDIENISNIVFFDSPIYIKIRKALQKNSTEYSHMMNLNLKHIKAKMYGYPEYQDKYLKGYPEYIDDLYRNLDLEYIDIADFDEISQEIQQIISGKFDISRSGDINYTDNQNNVIPLSLTAMGISNIGLIDLLLRNNVINKGSFLIMDEPEVHLHPEWQVILAKILYKIAKGGANIIIATHSLDFLKAFENILKKENEIAEGIIAINKMPYDESFSELSELEKVGIVLDDLSKPFYDLYMQDI